MFLKFELGFQTSEMESPSKSRFGDFLHRFGSRCILRPLGAILCSGSFGRTRLVASPNVKKVIFASGGSWRQNQWDNSRVIVSYDLWEKFELIFREIVKRDPESIFRFGAGGVEPPKRPI